MMMIIVFYFNMRSQLLSKDALAKPLSNAIDATLRLRTLPSDSQILRQRLRRDSRLDRSRRDTACIEFWATRICQLPSRARKDGSR